MLVKKLPYKPVVTKEYLDKVRQNQVKNIQKKIRQLNIKEEELLFVTT